jgi:hypothetical protein
MNDKHPITPPPELIKQWVSESNHNDPLFAQVAVMAARWGADQELDACCEWLKQEREEPGWANRINLHFLRAARRPKPPSLKEQALDELTSAERLYPADWSTIRRALEALPE